MILQLHNQLGSLGQDDLVNWECHMLASQEPGLPKRKSVTESAMLPSAKPKQSQYSSRVTTDMVTPSFLLRVLPSQDWLPAQYLQDSLVLIYNPFLPPE